MWPLVTGLAQHHALLVLPVVQRKEYFDKNKKICVSDTHKPYHTELLNVHFYSDSGNQACLRVLMIYNAKKQAKRQTRETRILWKW